MADASRVLEIVLSARDDASKVIKGIGGTINDLARDAQIGAGIIVGGLTLMGKGALDSASQFQQARISFDTMLGDTQKAGALLKDLSEFAAKTPFTLPEVLEGSKQLLAMGSSAESVKGEIKALGDVSAGLNVPMSRLIVNFGQVRTQGKLTGRELRDFNIAGVPLMDELVKVFNKTGGAMQMVGGTSAATKTKMDALNVTLQKQTNRLTEMTSKGNTSSAAYKNLNIDIENTKGKLAALGPVTSGVSKHIKVTKEDIAEMVEDGKIGFDQVREAFMSMTGEGGRFQDLMDRQSKTVPGIISNISDNFIRMSAAVMGVTTEGEVLAGGLFDRISQALLTFLNVLNEITPKISAFMAAFLSNTPAVITVIGALIGLMTPLLIAFVGLIAPALAFAAAGAAIAFALQFVIKHFEELWPFLLGIGAVIMAVIVPAFIAWAIAAITAAIGTITALLPILIPLALIGAAVTLLALAWKNNWLNIQGVVAGVVNWFKNTVLPFFDTEFGKGMLKIIDVLTGGWVTNFGKIKDAVMGVVHAIGDLINKAKEMASNAGKGMKIPGFQHGGVVPGAYNQAVPAILHGGERVIPRMGTDVNSGGGGISLSLNFTGPVSMDSGGRVQELADKIISILGRQNELAAKGIGF